MNLLRIFYSLEMPAGIICLIKKFRLVNELTTF